MQEAVHHSLEFSIGSMLKKLNWLAPALSIALFTGVGSAIVGTTTAQPTFAQSNAQSKQSIWKTFSPTGGGFSILMPGNPKQISQPLKIQTGDTVELIGYATDLGPKQGMYMVTYADMPFAASKESKLSQQALDGAMNAVLGKIQGELVSQQSFALKGYPGREATFRMNGNITGKIRMFLVENRFYQLLTLTAQEKATAKSVSGFFNSFKLVNN
ncbi:hypothetical protein ACN4EG_02930 [Alkalinema pantanalense CENA528]|uniref:hypothetical protein n=1 Tax=Alkalinema pantanalense TaxID=1620705 RepID=UPI003D6E3B81